MNLKKTIVGLLCSTFLLVTVVFGNTLGKEGFILQSDGYSCGPISIVNAVKSLGYNFNGNELAWLKYLQKVCYTGPNSGTNSNRIDDGLNDILRGTDLTYYQKVVRSPDELFHTLKPKQAAIFLGNHHFWVLTRFENGEYYTIEIRSGGSIKPATTNSIRHMFNGGNMIWVIYKKETMNGRLQTCQSRRWISSYPRR